MHGTFTQAEHVGVLVGTLLLPVVVGYLFWRRGRKKAGVGLGLLFLGAGLGNLGRGRDPAAALSALRTGCVKGCAAKDASRPCEPFCECMLREMRSGRDDTALARWITDHTREGEQDEAFTAERDRAAASCASTLR